MAMGKTVFAVDPESHSARMLVYLKDVMRAKGIRYADAAALMGVSEKSIKRYMVGRGVTLQILERLCAAVGLSVRELSDLAGAESNADLPWTTDEQEAVLVSDPRLSIVLGLLMSGWTAARIQAEGLTGVIEMNAILVRLDRLGVIALYPHNRTRLRARLRSIDTASGPLRRVISEAARRVIDSVDLADPGASWRLNYARLGPASVERVVKRLDAFLSEVAELSRQDMDLSGEEVRWYAVCGLITRHEVLGLKILRESSRGPTSEHPEGHDTSP